MCSDTKIRNPLLPPESSDRCYPPPHSSDIFTIFSLFITAKLPSCKVEKEGFQSAGTAAI